MWTRRTTRRDNTLSLFGRNEWISDYLSLTLTLLHLSLSLSLSRFTTSQGQPPVRVKVLCATFT